MIDRTRPSKKDWDGSQVRIGAVSYLNSKPLIEGLAESCPDSDLILDVPSRLADDLGHGRLDVALIPSVEAFGDPDYQIVSDACVATHGPVLSVKLYSRVHPGMIRTVALDEGSRTSAALTQIILHERFGVLPQRESLPLGKTTSDTTADAILLIGDRAISPPAEQFHTVWDLGEEWVNWTGLPFVFAMWVTHQQTNLRNIEEHLALARDRGCQDLRTIAHSGAEHLGLTFDTTYTYLTENLHFRLGPAERKGLQLFQELAANLGLARREPITFRGPAPKRQVLVS